ncbi:hypothetical protein EMCG_03071 [[Emmonsia] crescens]|uniref:Uncharacterized protein n=1 Tax=[Emmonsia] crescens TaxID=73230 RepID=A0A0G2HXL2_9EURO|nr:hypothetical protein EMCG_03071 [Emmonsia crescens UAMH 3008]
MPIARSPGIAIRATSSFATAISTSRSRWSRPLNNHMSCYLSTPYLYRLLSTRCPTAAHLPLLSQLYPSSSATTSLLRPIQKCALNTSASTSSSTPSSPSVESLNCPDASPSRTPSSSINNNNPSTLYINPHRAKRTWPPDMSKLSSKQQFRLERKYRRRAKLKWARPTWTKWTKLVQWAIIGYVLIYCVMFMDLEERENPFQPIRDYVHKSMKGLLSTSSPPSFQKEPTTPTPKS